MGEQQRWGIHPKAWVVFLVLVAAIAANMLRYSSIGRDSFMLDFHLVFTASTAYKLGDNPYENARLQQVWNAIPPEQKVGADRPLQPYPFMYPPAVLLLSQPFVLLPWNMALIVMLVMQFLCCIAIVYMLAQMGAFRHSAYDVLLLVLLLLGLKPLHLALFAGQPVLFSLAAGLAALYYLQNGRKYLALCLLTLASIKPTVGIIFLVYAAIKVSWRYATVAILSIALLNILAWVFLHPQGLASYITSVNATFQPGAINDASASAPTFYDLSSLKGMVTVLSGSDTLATIVQIVVLLIVLWFVYGVRKVMMQTPAYAMLLSAFISWFFLYHRSYDAIMFLVVFILFSPRELLRRLGWRSWWICLLLFPFTGLMIHWYARHAVSISLPTFLYQLLCYNMQIATIVLFVFFAGYLWYNKNTIIPLRGIDKG